MAAIKSLKEQRFEIYELWQRLGSARAVARELGLNPTSVNTWVDRVRRELNATGKTAATEKKVFENRIEPEIEIKPEPVPVADRVTADREAQRAQGDLRDLRDKYKHALEKIAELESQAEAFAATRQNVAPVRIQPDESIQGGQAAAILLASDWHVGEKVDPATVNYLNEYNPEIAERRAKNFFANGLRLVRKERQDINIDTLVLWLGGDLITGFIHEELQENNYLSPTEESRFAKSLIIGGLKMLKEQGEFKRIVVPCSFGNHGRTTPKRRVSTGYRNSYEWMMYHDLADLFAGDDVIQFQVVNGYLNYVEIYGKTLRFHHGDNVGYSGGVGGITISLNKFIARTNQQRRADCDFLGHFHQLDGYARWRKFVTNGSLIGFNSYAQSIAASPEEPLQAFQLLDAQRGFTLSAPVICEREMGEVVNRAKVAVAGKGGSNGKAKK